ncbi:AraC family transcriptional regulator [Paucibacter sp. R3-3]|uniref:AraC family transcriptional regulator n=1 Tax=Roseateles agri TaxID=3098619 RepID=A0ABU5DUD9_9BURK|nr:AraC family transcriptional regulator [Paucibacter sp. R3-3]MDY0749022.1 AraC family transcriptional regulator [Paucibacter sp. R3-3]
MARTEQKQGGLPARLLALDVAKALFRAIAPHSNPGRLSMATGETLQKFSTRAIPQAHRFDYWMSVLSDSLWQVTEWSDIPADFNVELRSAKLGSLTTLSECISPHRSRRTHTDLGRSEERSYHLFVSTAPAWGFEHRGIHGRLKNGDVLMLAEGEHETICPDGFTGIILKCPEDWMRTWLPHPELLAGQTLAHDSKWGRVLSPIIRQMTPEFALAPPLPQQVLVDQLGAILGLFAGDAHGQLMPDLTERIRECIRERCGDPGLTAEDIARALDVPPRVLHHALSTASSCFAAELISARVAVAVSLLTSRLCKQMTLPEIAVQSGFSSQAHFSRALKKRTGHGPLELRRALW